MRKITTIITIILLICIIAAAALTLRSGNFGIVTEPAPEPPLSVETQAPAATSVTTPEPTPEPTPESTPEPTPEPEPEYFTLSFVGDCTLASSQHHKGSAYAFEVITGEDYAYPFAETVQYFRDDYLSFANLESTFTTATQSNGGTFVFKSDPVYANVLAEGGIEFVTLANNHADDFLAQGREDTRAALDAVGVEYAGDDEWYICQRGDGVKVGVYCALYPELAGPAKTVAGVTALKEAGAEVIVCALHWGIEGSYQVLAAQEAVAYAAIDAGADIIWGSHPHVLHRTEEYNGGFILYSLGNWSFGGNTAPRDRDTAIAQITIKRDTDGSVSMDQVELIPCKLSGTDAYNDYQPRPYAPETAEYDRAMSKLDGSFAGPDLTIDYSAFHKNTSGGEDAPAG